MDIIEENENYTDLKLEGDTIVYRIQDAAQSGYNTIVLKIMKLRLLIQLLLKEPNIVSNLMKELIK